MYELTKCKIAQNVTWPIVNWPNVSTHETPQSKDIQPWKIPYIFL